jgi:hypothetical protein
MNKKILFLLLGASCIVSADEGSKFLPEQVVRSTCYAYSDYSLFDLRSLEKNTTDFAY